MPGVGVIRDVFKTPGFRKPRGLAKPVQDAYPAQFGLIRFSAIVEGEEGPLKEGELERSADWAKQILDSFLD